MTLGSLNRGPEIREITTHIVQGGVAYPKSKRECYDRINTTMAFQRPWTYPSIWVESASHHQP